MRREMDGSTRAGCTHLPILAQKARELRRGRPRYGRPPQAPRNSPSSIFRILRFKDFPSLTQHVVCSTVGVRWGVQQGWEPFHPRAPQSAACKTTLSFPLYTLNPLSLRNPTKVTPYSWATLTARLVGAPTATIIGTPASTAF